MKNRRKYTVLKLIALMASLALAASCDQKDLCYYHPHVAPVKVKVNWDSAGVKTIDGMTAHLFAKQGMDQKINTTVTTHNVDEIVFDVLEGKYDVTVFNNTPEEYSTLSFHDLTDLYNASVQVTEMKVPEWFTKYNVKTPDKYVAYQPEWIARGYSKDITVTEEMVKTAEDEYIAGGYSMKARTPTLADEVVPDSLTCTFTMKVNLKGIDNFYQARAIVTGLAIGKKIIDMEPLGETVSQYAGLDVWKLSNDGMTADGVGTIEGSITCFGLPAGKIPGQLAKGDITLTIEILLVDKKTIIKLEREIDGKECLEIGDLIVRDTISPKNLRMKEAITFPRDLPYVQPEDGKEGGFGVGFEDWEKEEIEILDH